MKKHEIRTIKEEIGKAKYVLGKLHEAIIDGNEVEPNPMVSYLSLNDLQNFGRFPMPNSEKSTTIMSPQVSKPTRTSSGRVVKNILKPTNFASDLIVRRDDDAFLKVSCLSCGRSDFANMQGFVNHCRIVHRMEFAGHPEAVRVCGTLVDPESVEENHDARRMAPIATSNLSWWDVSNTETKIGISESSEKYKQYIDYSYIEEKPQIKVFEQDVELHDDVQSQQNFRLTIVNNSDEDENEENIITSVRRGKGKRPRMRILNQPSSIYDVRDESVSEVDEIEDEKLENDEDPAKKHDILRSVDENSKIFDSDASIKLQKDMDKIDEISYIISSKDSIELKNTKFFLETCNILEKNEQLLNDIELDDAGIEELANQNEAISMGDGKKKEATILTASRVVITGPSVPASNPGESRFYIKKRVIIGNTSLWIPPHKREPGFNSHSHKWMVYIRSNPNFKEEIIRFFLHPDYKPYDVVDISRAPFRLKKFGWGEFPVRVQLHFVDSERNKPVDIVHIIQLDKQCTGRQVLGSERIFDIELDRNSTFEDPETTCFIKRPEKILENGELDLIKLKNENVDSVEATTTDEIAEFAVEKILQNTVKNYPLIVKT
ncbi:YEATS domain-containing protein 2, partial [Nowakowskiella sp. JEL0078]